MPAPSELHEYVEAATGHAFVGGPIHSCSECGSLVYAGRTTGRLYNAGRRPSYPSNAHECFPDTPPTTEADIPFEGGSEEGGQLPTTDLWSTGLTLPPGFTWYGRPESNDSPGSITTDLMASDYPERIRTLREWAPENGLVVKIMSLRDRWVAGVYTRRPTHIALMPEGMDYTPPSGIEFEEDFECVRCGETHLAYTTSCAAGPLGCLNCGFDRTVEGVEVRFAEDNVWCLNCGHECGEDGCDAFIRGEDTLCPEHGQHATCARCRTRMEVLVEEDVTWVTRGSMTLCEGCAERLCPRCERFSEAELTYLREAEEYVCRRCFIDALYGENREAFDEDALIHARRLRIPTIPGRENIRTCGVEIEGANGSGNGEHLAERLYDAELSGISEMAGYHHGSGTGFAHVESDSSVDWECVIGPLNPADQHDVTMLNRTVKTIREMVHDGTLGLDLRAGLHIHVGAERVSLDGAFNLNTLFCYLEDVLFRLGAARWPIHRAVANTHYTQPIPKELRKLEFARAHGEEGSRYYALSFNNYFRQMLRNCECGAVRYDSWEDCTCDLGKCTFEFRLFNTTANPKKLHAYLALTQALVAKALTMGKITDPSEVFPALDFVPQRFKDMDDDVQVSLSAGWTERLTWMFNELPLTDDEKDSLIYCIRYSELEAIGGETINELFPQEVAEEVLA